MLYCTFNLTLSHCILSSLLLTDLIFYPTPITSHSFYNVGSLVGLLMLSQLISGVLLACFYIPALVLAFNSVSYLMHSVNYGWAVRYLHSTGASFFFTCSYLHIVRGIYYGSYQNQRNSVYFSGIILFTFSLFAAFIGYVLPFSQVSYYAAIVITNNLSILPFIGLSLIHCLWGGFNVCAPTLVRFYSLHFILGFWMVALAFLHLVLLHNIGSSSPLFGGLQKELVLFHP